MDKAQDLVKRPALSEDDLERRFAITVQDAISNGLTSIHDAGFDPLSLQFFKRYGCSVIHSLLSDTWVSGNQALGICPFVFTG